MSTQLRRGAALLVGTTTLLALVACSSQQPNPSGPANPTMTVTATAQAAARSADDPIDALDAWVACSSIAQSGYVHDHPGATAMAYDATKAPQKNADGSFNVIVGITPGADSGVTGGIIALCRVRGTVGSPIVVRSTFKDV